MSSPNRRMRSPRPTRRVGAALAGAVLVVAGCGGSADLGEPTANADEVSFEEWRSELSAGCAELTDRQERLATVELRTADDAQAHADDVATFSADYAELFDAAGLPDRRSADAAELVDSAQRLAVAGGELAAAARRGDADAAQRAVDRLAELGSRLDRRTRELGLGACGGFEGG